VDRGVELGPEKRVNRRRRGSIGHDKATDVNSPATGPGTISPDGNYIWNGTQWVRNIPAPAPTSTTGPGTVSPDGNFWNGTNWVRNAPAPTAKPVKKINHGKRRLVFIGVFLSPFVLVGILLGVGVARRGSVLVNYQVTGDAGTASIGYAGFDSQHVSQFTQDGKASLPVSIDVHGSTGVPVMLRAIGADGGLVQCTITVDGQVIAVDTGVGSTGASCKAEIP
jgi:hypothetical protein